MASDISNAQIDALIAHARRAHERAYCPYSNFPVGAAILSADGQIFTGCNIENASYSLAIAPSESLSSE